MLTLEGLNIRQGAFELSADIHIQDGARVAIIGPSGAGKSTLLSAIAGFLPLHHGRILWDGQDIGALSPGQRPLSMVFQEANLFPHLNIAQNVGLGLRPDLKLSSAQHERIAQALEVVGLGGMEVRKPAQLSGGQQSRAALARVLVQDRPLVLLDEPFAALGPALKAEMLDLVSELLDRTGATLLMVSHDPQDARRITSQTVLVAEGQATGPHDTGALLDDPPAALREYLG